MVYILKLLRDLFLYWCKGTKVIEEDPELQQLFPLYTPTKGQEEYPR